MRKSACKSAGTLCWCCNNAYGGCSWSRNGTPVRGWAAAASFLPRKKNDPEPIGSFAVLRCPEFVPDHRFDEEYLRFLCKTGDWRSFVRESDPQLQTL